MLPETKPELMMHACVKLIFRNISRWGRCYRSVGGATCMCHGAHTHETCTEHATAASHISRSSQLFTFHLCFSNLIFQCFQWKGNKMAANGFSCSNYLTSMVTRCMSKSVSQQLHKPTQRANWSRMTSVWTHALSQKRTGALPLSRMVTNKTATITYEQNNLKIFSFPKL